MKSKMPAKNMMLLLMTAFIWGTTFVMQRLGAEHVGAFTFNGARFAVGAAVLLPAAFFYENRIRKTDENPAAAERRRRVTLRAGLACGICMWAASGLQQMAIPLTEVGKAGFLTALYIVMVPVFHFFLFRTSNGRTWAGVALSLAGLYLLSMQEGLTLEKADILLLLCAMIFAIHILTVDRLGGEANGVGISCLQFAVAALLSFAVAFAFESPDTASIRTALVPIAYAGILSCGVAYTFQILGQKNADPAIASLILSLESVISAAGGFFVLGQSLSPREIAGCALMFLAVVIVQLPEKAEAGTLSCETGQET